LNDDSIFSLNMHNRFGPSGPLWPASVSIQHRSAGKANGMFWRLRFILGQGVGRQALGEVCALTC
jgi:hypothetical protein